MNLKNVKLVFEIMEKMQSDIRKHKYNSMNDMVKTYSLNYNLNIDIVEFISKKALQNMWDQFFKKTIDKMLKMCYNIIKLREKR